jgi:hypothetical protein
MASPPAARDWDILISPRAHGRICSIAWRGRESGGCIDSKRCRTCSAQAAAHRASSRWSESVSVPPRRIVMNRGSRSLGRITAPPYGAAARTLNAGLARPASRPRSRSTTQDPANSHTGTTLVTPDREPALGGMAGGRSACLTGAPLPQVATMAAPARCHSRQDGGLALRTRR